MSPDDLPLTFEQVSTLPAEELALPLLRAIVASLSPPSKPFLRRDLLIRVLDATDPPTPAPPKFGGIPVPQPDDAIRHHPEVALNLAAAFQRLEHDGLVVDWVGLAQARAGDESEVYRVTPLGQLVLGKGQYGRSFLTARRRLGVELHPTLATKLRPLVAVGAFESATMVALRAVEARVRGLCETPRNGQGARLTGDKLMAHAFAPKGPLADPLAEPGEQVGLMELFKGTFGAVRNVVMHTEAEWSDDVEAAEYVLLADLLMRRLDKAEARLAER